MIKLLLVEGMTTSQIATALSTPLSYTRDQLTRMHHLDMVEAVGIRQEEGRQQLFGYFQDVFWGLTVHSREHRLIEPGCRGCTTRQWLLASAEAILE